MAESTYIPATPEGNSPQNLSPDALIDYIVKQHHARTKALLPQLATYMQKIAEEHGEDYPALYDIDMLLTEVIGELSEHMLHEEQVLFSSIHGLSDVQFVQRDSTEAYLVATNISRMEDEHRHVHALMQQIRTLANGYTPPLTAGNAWRLVFSELNAFERDLNEHLHLENDLLFPAARAMEEALL